MPFGTPEAWKNAVSDRSVDVLPLARDGKKDRIPGWCTYTHEHEQAPELEVLCGGINYKTPQAGAVWRQGHLLHFGFDLAPSEMSNAGRALLVNAIAYVSRFTEDRPIVRTPCVFTQGTRIFDRDAIARRLQGSDEDLKALEYYLTKETYAKLKGKTRAQLVEWFKDARDYLHAGDGQGLLMDVEARSFGVPPSSPEFFPKAIAGLGDQGPARRLLGRYAPEGPGTDAKPEQWRAWWEENRKYLFFSDTGGYRWYIDPLAKRRRVPTSGLRGPARATRPPLRAVES
ncbi:MAG: hypothetical protein HYS12_06410 [Planctomycetes bacterium]|nr:hypothetical protein [Planctomycetota bacterium]